jgi:hypothetical protein
LSDDYIKLVKKSGKHYPLPKQVVSEVTAIMGITGSGKTYAGGRWAEEMNRLRAQFVAIEPVGNWWGLRVKADGKGRGIDIPIFGGEHGDLPLPVESGAEVARLVVAQRLSAVLDVSGFSKRGMRKFSADFAETFFQLKKRNKSPVNLIVEEARVFIPQKIHKGDEGAARLLGAFEDIGRRGRNYGIGMCLLDQRPQSVNKDVLSQAQNLIVLQLIGAHETKAVREWVKENARATDGSQWWEDLDGLAQGEAFLWSPRRQIFERVKVTRKWTYDASATPDFDDNTPAPTLSQIDVGKIRDALEATIEKAKETDPKELTKKIKAQAKEIARLNRELVTRPAEVTTETVVEHHPPPAIVARLAAEVKVTADDLTDMMGSTREHMHAIEAVLLPRLGVVYDELRAAAAQKPTSAAKVKKPPKAKMFRAPPAADAVPINGEVTVSHRRLLDALAKLENIGLEVATNQQVGFVSGYKLSGRFHNLRGELRKLGLVEYVAGANTRLTDAGRAIADAPDAPLTTEDLHETVFSMITSSQRKLLEVLIEAYPDPLTNEELGEKTDYRLSGRFHNLRGELKSMGLVDYPAGAQTAASSMLFLEDRT